MGGTRWAWLALGLMMLGILFYELRESGIRLPKLRCGGPSELEVRVNELEAEVESLKSRISSASSRLDDVERDVSRLDD